MNIFKETFLLKIVWWNTRRYSGFATARFCAPYRASSLSGWDVMMHIGHLIYCLLQIKFVYPTKASFI